jgi:hypothetical protein
MYALCAAVHAARRPVWQYYVGDRIAQSPELAVAGFREHMLYMPHSYQALAFPRT